MIASMLKTLIKTTAVEVWSGPEINKCANWIALLRTLAHLDLTVAYIISNRGFNICTALCFYSFVLKHDRNIESKDLRPPLAFPRRKTTAGFFPEFFCADLLLDYYTDNYPPCVFIFSFSLLIWYLDIIILSSGPVLSHLRSPSCPQINRLFTFIINRLLWSKSQIPDDFPQNVSLGYFEI